ncbi:MAG: hypothetical protein ACI9WU_000051 [Myxococcota bacterium]
MVWADSGGQGRVSGHSHEPYLVRLHVRPTYEGVLEGTPTTASRYILQGAQADTRNILGPGVPCIVLAPKTKELPSHQLFGHFQSLRGVRHSDPDYRSKLYVCWFVEDLSAPIGEMATDMLERVDWSASAVDYNIMDF